MPVEFIVKDRKYYNQYKNQLTFGGNLSDYTSNLAGSVMEKIKVVTDFRVEWYGEANSVYSWEVTHEGSNLVRFERQSGSWIEDGFAIGDDVDWYIGDPPTSIPGTLDGDVTSISEKIMFVQLSVSWPGSWGTNDFETEDSMLHGKTLLNASILKFGLIENNENFNVISKVSENDQAFYASGIASYFVNYESLGIYEDWNVSDVDAAKIKRTYLTPPTVGAYYQEFQIEHIIIINPWYLVGELTNLENNLIPDLYAGLKSLKYVFEVEMRTQLSDPNTSKIARDEIQLGSTGWFNENFNGFDSNYQVDSISYADTSGNTADGLLINQRTVVTINLSKITGSFVAGGKLMLFISYLPSNENQYKDTETSLEENFIYHNTDHIVGTTTITPAVNSIKEVTSSLSSGDVIIEMEVEYSSDEQELISEGDNFLISVLAGDNSLSTAASDKVMLIAGVGQYDVAADIPGLMDVTKLRIFNHPIDITSDTGFTDMTLWNEDGVDCEIEFYLDLSKEAFLNNLRFQVIAYNTVTDEYFIIDQYSFPISDAIVSDDVQQLEVDNTRGYRLKLGDQFNDAFLTTGSLVGDLQYYTGKIAVKIPWQEWIALLSADSIFYDSSQDQNGLNKKTSNYAGINDYQIKFALFANLDGVNDVGETGSTDYQFISPDLVVYDYDLPTDWSATIETFHPTTGVNLGGAILSDEDTHFKITWDKASGAVPAIVNHWAIHRIEVTGQNGTDIYELSSINDYPTGNLLKPLSGETHLKMSLSSGDIVTECLIDKNFINPGDNYNISGRLDDGEGGSPTPADGKLTSGASPFAKVTDSLSNDFKIISP